MTESSLPEEAIFAEAREIRSVAGRAAFLDRACGDDPVLRAEVEALLRADARTGDLLDLAEGPAATVDRPSAERPGAVIGPYRLLEEIGEGGMGTVYLAEQAHPVRRRVALKVIRPGLDSRQVIARFEAERQALALMDHPNIAKVLDAGTTQAGRPYFVMELVKGVPITRYCDELRLTPRERLELFIPVCQAVQHAHQKGVIHRDLKPSNILIAPYDGVPVPKVIDFGVAKAAGQRLTEATLFTGFGAVIGTPEYMSPEQAELNNQDIDTRSDVYSLGVLLYELLTGTTPLTGKRVREAALLEVLRLIREEDSPCPSTRLSATSELPLIAAQRGVGPSGLSKLVRGELDWIVMKALEKDRGRRYETASGLAADLERYLRDEPVSACPPSTIYGLGKFARRHRAGLAVAMAAATTLLLSVAGLAVSNRLIAASKHETVRALQQKELALIQAEANAREAVEQRHRAEESSRKALTAVRDLLISPAISHAEWSQIPAPLRRKFRDEAARFFASLLKGGTGDRSLRYETAVGQRALGFLYQRTEGAEQAESLLRQSVETLEGLRREAPKNLDYRQQLALSHFALFQVLWWQRRLEEADATAQQAIELYEGLMAERADVPGYANELLDLYVEMGSMLAKERGHLDEAERMCHRAIEIHERRVARYPDEPLTPSQRVKGYEGLTLIHLQSGRRKEAAEVYGRALAVVPDDPRRWYGAAPLYLLSGDVEGYRRACAELVGHAEKFAASSKRAPNVADWAAKTCALSPDSVPDFSRVERLAERCVTGTENHPWRRNFFLAKALIDYRAGRHEEAIRWLKQFTPQAEGEHFDATALAALAMAHHRLGQEDEAHVLLATARRIMTRKPSDAMLIGFWFDWLHAEILVREAEALIGVLSAQELASLCRERRDRELAALSDEVQARPDHPEPLTQRARLYVRSGRFEEAVSDFDRLVRLVPADPWHWYHRGSLLAYLGREAEFREHCRAMLEQFANSQNTFVLDRTTKTALLLPGGVGGDVQRLAERARNAQPNDPNDRWFALLMGMAEFRAGRPNDAIPWLEKSRAADVPARWAAAEAFLAMAHHRLGSEDKAATALARCVQLIERDLPRAGVEDLTEGTAGIENWLIAHTVRREAEDLIQRKSPK